MRVSRPCYDKQRRCPGWAGPGWRRAKVDRCDGGTLPRGGRWWLWQMGRCPVCGLFVLPYAVRWVDPTWWGFYVRRLVERRNLRR